MERAQEFGGALVVAHHAQRPCVTRIEAAACLAALRCTSGAFHPTADDGKLNQVFELGKEQTRRLGGASGV